MGIQVGFEHPWALLLALPLLALLYLLERWRRRPVVVEVADLSLFQPSPEAEAEARARRRRVGMRWLLRALATLLLVLAVAGAGLRTGAPGPVTVELVLDAGVTSGAREGAGTRLDRHREHLGAVLDRLRPDDRVRVQRLPVGAFPPPRPVAPDEARELVSSTRPTAGRADVVGAVERLVTAAVTPGRVFVASDQPLEREGVALATCGSPLSNRGILSLREEQGALYVAVGASAEAGGDVELQLSARGPRGAEHATLTLEVPGGGQALARWQLPAGAEEASARLLGDDDLPTDDLGFAVRSPLAELRVAVVGAPGADVERALSAVPGVQLERVAATDRLRALEERADVLVLPRMPQALPSVATVVVPPGVVKALARPGGRLRGDGEAEGLPHTYAALAADPVLFSEVGPLPKGLGSLRPRILAGKAPLLLAGGTGRRLIAVFTAPLSGSPWARRRSFPLLWGELLGLAGGQAGRPLLRSHQAGEASALGRAAWQVARHRDGAGRPALGTVAAPADGGGPGLRPFAEDALRAIDAGRPPAPRASLAPGLALLALLLALGGWWPREARIPSKLGRQPLPHP